MIKARHKPFWVQFFHWYTHIMLKRHFARVDIKGQIDASGHPVLVIGNHVSWWDGFWALHVNRQLWNKHFHIMMLEEELRTRMFLNKAGAFSIKKHSRDIFESLHYTLDVLKNPDNVAVMFPQGEIRSMHEFPVTFDKGIWYLIKKLPADVKVVFQIALTDYFSSVKPFLRFYVQEINKKSIPSHKILQENFNAYLKECIARQTPDAFKTNTL